MSQSQRYVLGEVRVLSSRRTRRARAKARPSVPTELTPRAEWPTPPADAEVTEPDPVATQPMPVDEPAPGTAVVTAIDSGKLTREQADWILKNRKACAHCHGHHQRYCPRVREVTLYPDGNVQTAKYWRTFDDSFIIWPEDLAVED